MVELTAKTGPRAEAELASPLRMPALDFSAVYEEHAAFVWRCVRRLGVREADVADASQEVFLVAHRKLSEFQQGTNLRSWLFAICIRVAAAHRRRAWVRRERATDAVAVEDETPANQGDDLDRKRTREKLDGILDRLDDDKRAVFVLFELEETSMADVAAAVGCPLQTAYSRLHAARRQVEAAVRRLHEGGWP